MRSTDIPVKFDIPWAADAPTSNRQYPIPTPAQPSGRASLTTGYGPVNSTPVAAGGIPPFGEDENGIFYWLSAWAQFVQAGGGVLDYDSAFQTTIGGYPEGAFVQSATTPGMFWLSTVENNMTNPDASGAGWKSLASYILANAALTGIPTAPTAAVNSSNNQVANTFYSDRSSTNAGNAAVAAAELWVSQNFLPLTGGTLTGNLVIAPPTGNAVLELENSPGNGSGILFNANSQTNWELFVSNAGNFFLERYVGGTFVDSPFNVIQSTGVLNFAHIPTCPTASQGDTSTNEANCAFVNNAILTSGYSQNRALFTNPGTFTFTVPANIFAIFVQVVGAGGAGAGSSSTYNGGAGGAGGYAEGWCLVTPGQNITVIVGAGGIVTTGNGGNGGTTTFGSPSTFMSATGGSGGRGNIGNIAGGFGGVGSTGTLNLQGGAGTDGTTFATACGTGGFWTGVGGASYYGGGSRSGTISGSPAGAFGSGGGSSYANTTPTGGQPGTSGMVSVTW